MTNDQRPYTSHWESNTGKDMGWISRMYCAQNSDPWLGQNFGPMKENKLGSVNESEKPSLS